MLVIEAAASGFHARSPLGDALAPDVFLNAAPDPAGGIVLPVAGTQWWTDSWPALPGATRARLQADTALDPAQPGDGSAALRLTGIAWTRLEADGPVPIATLRLETPLAVTATHDPGGSAAAPTWLAAAAAALAEAVQHSGLRFQGGAGDDVFRPAAEVLPLYAPVVLLGRGGNDALHGGRADEVLRGGAGDDLLTDAGGRSRLHGGGGDDTLKAGAFSDGSALRGGRGDDLVISSNGDDRLWGNAGRDRLEGGRGDDRLRGGQGDDRLDGGEGGDRLSGGRGDDLLSGGEGADTFVFRAAQEGHDVIDDYQPGLDRLLLRGAEGRLVQDGDDVLLLWDNPDAGARILGVAVEDVTLDHWGVQIL
ncbi:hypothetical protein GE300_10910 [Rhodobacteraceae bacterium 2CG4]|uniref:Hemolysin type calcium-binding protein n=1 Tax=Halovulum marinum TaxID=2662447 RepID=A0A6L5Z220_9RHOB|nr:hypothetical protein [Halovulum marinum]MSU90120.1 hypothetical protein [Halovulum marinum]